MLTGTWSSFRCHLLVDRHFDYMIVSNVVHDIPWFSTLVDQSEKIYSSLVADKTTLDSIETSDIHFGMTKIKLELDNRSLV